jgi:uncharacterized protein (TIGR02145 family)
VRLIKDTPWAPFAVEYGYLYNWYAATDPRNIAAAGWHIMTETERDSLIAFLGGDAAGGGKLKEMGITYWDAPNVDATNEVSFNARGAGYRSSSNGAFSNFKSYSLFWTATSYDINFARYFAIRNSDGLLLTDQTFAGQFKSGGNSIRPIKDTTTLTHGQTGIYQGNDLKIYRTICINGVEYLADNLCETLYRNGDLIPEVTDDAAWAALTKGARCSYNNDESYAHA